MSVPASTVPAKPASRLRSSATLSPCGTYRYNLYRAWDDGPTATFVMLNPSTADETTDDPTIRRCLGFARAWGCGALRVLNLYALRSTDPRALARHPDPVGPHNDRYLQDHAQAALHHRAPFVAAWGAHAKADRVSAFLALPGVPAALTCLGVTKAGAPRHPLYLPRTAVKQRWPVLDQAWRVR